MSVSKLLPANLQNLTHATMLSITVWFGRHGPAAIVNLSQGNVASSSQNRLEHG